MWLQTSIENNLFFAFVCYITIHFSFYLLVLTHILTNFIQFQWPFWCERPRDSMCAYPSHRNNNSFISSVKLKHSTYYIWTVNDLPPINFAVHPALRHFRKIEEETMIAYPKIFYADPLHSSALLYTNLYQKVKYLYLHSQGLRMKRRVKPKWHL